MSDFENGSEAADENLVPEEMKSGNPLTEDEANLKELGFIELIYGMIIAPVSTFRRISGYPPLFKSFIIFLVVALLSSLTNSLLPDASVMPPEYSDILAQAGPYLSVISMLTYLILWFVQGGVLQVFGELLGGKGKALATLTVIALAEIPKVLLIPFQVIDYFLEGSTVGAVIYALAAIASMMWSLSLLVLGFREIHGISTFKAVAALLAPFLIFILLIILFLAGLIVFLYPMASSLNGI